MIELVRDVFPDDMAIEFMDDWDLYHMGLGEVHCGSNVKRAPSQAWWTEGGHLLSEDE
jgi:protein-arginine deiminase